MNPGQAGILFCPGFWYCALTTAFLIAEDGLNGRVQIDVDSGVGESAQLSDPVSERRHHQEQGLPLIDAQGRNVSPVSRHVRESLHAEQSAHDLLELYGIHELLQRQQSAEGGKPFAAILVVRIRADFCWFLLAFILALIQATFRVMLLL